MFQIMLLLCYSLIDTNTIPFFFSLSQIGRAEPRTQRFGLTVSFRRFLSSFYEYYPMGGASISPFLKLFSLLKFQMFGKLLKMKVFTISPTSLMPQLGQAVVRPQHETSEH